MKPWLKENWFKAGVLVLILSALVGYIRHEEFSRCLKTYDSGWTEFFSKTPFVISVAELCQKGYSFSESIDVLRQTRDEVEGEYEKKYVDLDNYWLQEQLKKDTGDRLRYRLGL